MSKKKYHLHMEEVDFEAVNEVRYEHFEIHDMWETFTHFDESMCERVYIQGLEDQRDPRSRILVLVLNDEEYHRFTAPLDTLQEVLQFINPSTEERKKEMVKRYF